MTWINLELKIKFVLKLKRRLYTRGFQLWAEDCCPGGRGAIGLLLSFLQRHISDLQVICEWAIIVTGIRKNDARDGNQTRSKYI